MDANTALAWATMSENARLRERMTLREDALKAVARYAETLALEALIEVRRLLPAGVAGVVFTEVDNTVDIVRLHGPGGELLWERDEGEADGLVDDLVPAEDCLWEAFDLAERGRLGSFYSPFRSVPSGGPDEPDYEGTWSFTIEEGGPGRLPGFCPCTKSGQHVMSDDGRSCEACGEGMEGEA